MSNIAPEPEHLFSFKGKVVSPPLFFAYFMLVSFREGKTCSFGHTEKWLSRLVTYASSFFCIASIMKYIFFQSLVFCQVKYQPYRSNRKFLESRSGLEHSGEKHRRTDGSGSCWRIPRRRWFCRREAPELANSTGQCSKSRLQLDV